MVHNKHFFGKGLKVFLIGLSAILLTLKPSFAQVYPVQANINVAPPYSVYLSHYTSSEQEKVLVSILLRDPVIPSIDVKFRFTIEGAGIKLTTNPGWNPQPYTLNGGVLVNLEQEIIAEYLKPQHLLTEGVNPQDFFRGGKLPEGYYQFKVEVIEYRRNIVISNVGRTGLWLMLNEAPRIVFPLAGQKVKSTNPQMLNFSWTPSGTSSPLSNLTTQYEFTLVEMVDNSMDPNVAITTASNASKFVRVLDQTSMLYGPADMPLTPGKTYAIRVKAFNTEGYELYKNNGYSQVQTFTFGDACPIPLSLTLKNPKQSQFDVDVITDPSNTAWQIRFRESGSSDVDWSELKSEPNTTSKTTKGLKPKTEYEVQVRGLCGEILSGYTQSQTITTAPMVDANRVCNNNATPFVVEQAGPLGNLKVNDVFLAALFPVKVKEIKSQGGGKFSGRGFATLPLFNTGLAVTFDDISINSLMQLTAGEVVVVRDKLNMTLFGETENPTTGGAGDGTDGTGGGGTSDNPDYPPIKDTIIIPAVYDSLVVTGNTLTYYLPNSTNPVTIDLGGEGSTLLVPADGKMENAKIVYDGAAHPYTPGQGGDSTADPVNFTGLFARFKANPQQTHGFDTLNPKHTSIANYYKLLQVAGKQFYLPWKALKEGTAEPVNLVIKQGADKMPFSNLKVEQIGVGSLTPLTGAGTGLQTFNLRGSYKGAEESVLASFTLDGEEKYAGAIYLATYGEKNFKVYLVPLNGATVEAGAAAQLQQGLNSIYSQAVVKWSVEPLNGMPTVELGENGLDWADKEMLSSYNAEMNSVISAFKTWKPAADRDAYYLFIVPKFSEGGVEGFMPRNRSFGFITKEQIADRLVAHELGHGVFNLKHTFSDWAIQQGSTDNLMDYAQGTRLLKPQWDYIHNPELTTGLWDDMEDGASMEKYYSVNVAGIVDISSQFSQEISYITPSGSIITLPNTYKPSFTGRTNNETLDKSVAKGCLLGFFNGENYVAKFKTINNEWQFVGYVKSKTGDIFYGVTGGTLTKIVLIGKEGDNCSLIISKGDYTSIPYKENQNSNILKGEISLKTENIVATVTIPDCLNSCKDNLCPDPEASYKDLIIGNISNVYKTEWGGYLTHNQVDGVDIFVFSRKEGDDYKYYKYVKGGVNCCEKWVPYDLPKATNQEQLLIVLSALGHGTVDLIGVFPGVGEVMDGINAGWYYLEGDKENAKMSVVSLMLPVIGDFAGKGAKYSIKIVKGLKLSSRVIRTFEFTEITYKSILGISSKLKNVKKIECNECIEQFAELLTKADYSIPGIEKIADKIADAETLKSLLDDLVKNDKFAKEFLAKVAENEEMAEAWEVISTGSESFRRNTANIEKLAKFMTETGMEKSKLISSFGNTKDAQKWIDMKISEGELDAVYNGLKNSPPSSLTPWTAEHKAQRWAQFKAKIADEGGVLEDYKTWSNKYDGNIDKAVSATKGVDDYFATLGEGCVREKSITNITINTPEGVQTVTRRLDIVDEDAFKGIEFKEYSGGTVYRSPDIKRELALDEKILKDKRLDEIEWVFKGCKPSGPLKTDLEAAGIKVTLIP